MILKNSANFPLKMKLTKMNEKASSDEGAFLPPLCKGRWIAVRRAGGIDLKEEVRVKREEVGNL